MAKDCPKKPRRDKDKKTGYHKRRESSARVTEVESADDEAKSDLEIKSQASTYSHATNVTKATSLLAQINKLSVEDKSSVVDSLVSEGF
jgi:hypothetical protein